MNTKPCNFILAASLAFAASFLTLLTGGCVQPPVKISSAAHEVNLYFDSSIKFLDQETRERLIEELVNGLKTNPQITKVKLVEFGKEKKANEVFSTDFDLGAPVNCTFTIPRELTGNAEAERQARETAQSKCDTEFEHRSKQAGEILKGMAEILRQPPLGLSPCTSFGDLIARLKSDQPTIALIVSDGRANCQENNETYNTLRTARLLVIQCPSPDGKTAEYSAQLKQMFPTAEIFPQHKISAAMKSLAAPNLTEAKANNK